MRYYNKHFGEVELKKEIFNQFYLPPPGHRFLVNLVKLKPELADEALLPWLTEFSNLVDRCCGAAEPGACFSEEVVTFIFP